MNKKTIFCLCVLCFTASYSYGDIVPMNAHRVDVCVTIINFNDFENVVFIAQQNFGKECGRYIIRDNKCLNRGYKFNSLAIYWAKKDYVKKENFKTLKIENNEDNVHQIISNIPESSINVSNEISIYRIEVFYKIMPHKKGFYLKKVKRISKFNDGSSDVITLFELSDDSVTKK